MNRTLILQHVPNADPRFVAILEKASDPPVAVRERVLQRLPDLHRAFLEKVHAEQAQDFDLWQRTIDKESAIIAACDVW